MPNWCLNNLRVKGPAESIKNFKDQAVGHYPWLPGLEAEAPCVLNFHSLVPIPKDVLDSTYVDTGYNWELANWGCRCGANEAQLIDEWEDTLIYQFDTAWSPPVKFLEQLGPKWPALVFVLDYEEPGMGYKGICRVENDKVEDHCLSH